MEDLFKAVNPMLDVRHGLENERFGLIVIAQDNEDPNKVAIRERLNILSIEITAIHNMLDHVSNTLIEQTNKTPEQLNDLVVEMLKQEVKELQEAIKNDTENKKYKYCIEQNAIMKLLKYYKVGESND